MATFGKSLLAATLVSAACWVARPYLPGEGQLGAIVELAALGTFGLLAYGGLLTVMRVPLIAALLGARRARQKATEARSGEPRPSSS
ncbi:hypothetical protein D3C86_1831370 [compost metagenome]